MVLYWGTESLARFVGRRMLMEELDGVDRRGHLKRWVSVPLDGWQR